MGPLAALYPGYHVLRCRRYTMPTVLRQAGYRFFFFSNEGNEPPHIHVERGEAYAKFWLQPVSLARSRGFPAQELTRLRKMVEACESEFLKRWSEYFGH